MIVSQNFSNPGPPEQTFGAESRTFFSPWSLWTLTLIRARGGGSGTHSVVLASGVGSGLGVGFGVGVGMIVGVGEGAGFRMIGVGVAPGCGVPGVPGFPGPMGVVGSSSVMRRVQAIRATEHSAKTNPTRNLSMPAPRLLEFTLDHHI
jgi:hypothetical protein